MTTTTTRDEPDDAGLAWMALRAARTINLRHFRGDADVREAVWKLRDAAAVLLRLLADRKQGAA